MLKYTQPPRLKANTEKKPSANEIVEEPVQWTPFTFDGSQALKSKLVLNLRNCQYDLFRSIALEELGWKVIDYNNKVWEMSDVKKQEPPEPNASDGGESTGDNST
jgi:hypothetical protein